MIWNGPVRDFVRFAKSALSVHIWLTKSGSSPPSLRPTLGLRNSPRASCCKWHSSCWLEFLPKRSSGWNESPNNSSVYHKKPWKMDTPSYASVKTGSCKELTNFAETIQEIGTVTFNNSIFQMALVYQLWIRCRWSRLDSFSARRARKAFTCF